MILTGIEPGAFGIEVQGHYQLIHGDKEILVEKTSLHNHHTKIGVTFMKISFFHQNFFVLVDQLVVR